MIELNWSIFIQMINFLLLIFILNIVLYKPILKILNERETKILDAQNKIKELSDETSKLISNYNNKLQEAKVAAVTEKNNAKKSAVDKANSIIEESRIEAEDYILKMKQQISQEIETARKEFEPELEKIGLTIAEQVLGRKVA